MLHTSSNSGELPVSVWVRKPWIGSDIKLGQVSGVSIDPDDFIYLFHRADRIWDGTSFSPDNVYTGKDLGPISFATILIFTKEGALSKQLGENM